jgi:hypothetical protein
LLAKGDIWLETRGTFVTEWSCFLCTEGSVYNVNEWAACQVSSGGSVPGLRVGPDQCHARPGRPPASPPPPQPPCAPLQKLQKQLPANSHSVYLRLAPAKKRGGKAKPNRADVSFEDFLQHLKEKMNEETAGSSAAASPGSPKTESGTPGKGRSRSGKRRK